MCNKYYYLYLYIITVAILCYVLIMTLRKNLPWANTGNTTTLKTVAGPLKITLFFTASLRYIKNNLYYIVSSDLMYMYVA